MEAIPGVSRKLASGRDGADNPGSFIPSGLLPNPEKQAGATSSAQFCGYPNSTHFVKDLRKKLADAVTVAEKIPQDEMNYLVCSTYSEFVDKVAVGTSQITAMMKNLSHYWGVPAATYRHFEQPQNKAAIVQGIDETTKQLKERMDMTLDELARLKEEHSAAPSFIAPGVQPTAGGKAGKARFPTRTAAVVRPQIAHGWKIDNSHSPFVPRITVKHNALRSLELSMNEPGPGDGKAPHPYQFELDLFEPEEQRLALKPPIPAKKPAETEFSYIDTLEEFQRSLLELASAKDLAVDVEHHSYRTYLGITCLIQISSRTKDYVFDTIALRDHIHELNAVFTNPKILKVFHGGNLDIQWLQRDFGVYVVNMFDTGQACRVLPLPRFSLAFLVQHYLGRIIDKTHQTSDWRVRPIPNDMLDYARSDTHDLLFLYDCLRNDLIRKDPSLGLLQQVYVQSKSVCLQRYEKQTTDVNDFAMIMWRFAKNFSEQQKFALKRILEWRDDVARDLDESIGFVLPTKACVDLAEELPRTSDDLVKCLEFVPVVLKQKIHQMLDILKEARAFTGIVPVPVRVENDPAVDVDTAHEVMQRKIMQPLTADEFAKRHGGGGGVPARSSELVWEERKGNAAGALEDPEKMRLAHVWMHFQTFSAEEEAAEKARPRLETEKPNVKVSVPLELPLATVAADKPTDPKPARSDRPKPVKDTVKAISNTREPAKKIDAPPTGKPAPSTGKPAPPTGKPAPPTGNPAPLSAASAVSTSGLETTVRPEMPSSSPDVLQLPTKRAAFDYQSADYSKFAAGGTGGPDKKKRQAGKQHPGGLKDPNKRFNQKRNMTENASKTFGGGRFRKPD
ncbi:Exosome component 10 [Hypsibius exemplaris]|uniref:Exosome component 10 n=1 Tax=Hypsibius exemplaris TaxID=2072580 RepID=A0A1W0X160_HYPEX|nr:Exosome component 10 [Hypsibius exemplaris]